MKKSKYGNSSVVAGGMQFDSTAEANRYFDLLILERARVIRDLRRQVEFELIPAQKTSLATERAVNYIADFTYIQEDVLVVEDVKSAPTKTPEYVIKRKLMLFIHGIAIKETMLPRTTRKGSSRMHNEALAKSAVSKRIQRGSCQ